MSGPWEDFKRTEQGPWADYRGARRARAQADARRNSAKADRFGNILTGQGLMFGFGDEFSGLVAGAERGVKNAFATARGKPIPYTAAEARAAVTQAEREANNAFAQRKPVTNAALQIGGSLLTGGVGAPARVITGARSLGGVVARSAGLGAGAGAVAGAGTAEGGFGRRAIGATKGAAVGAAVGAGTPYVARGAVAGGRAVAGAAKRRQPVPTAADMATRKRDAYTAVDNSGARYTPEGFAGAIRDIEGELAAAKFNPRLHRKAAVMLRSLKDAAKAGESPTLTEVDQWRQIIQRDVASVAEEGDAEMGRRMKSGIDNFVERATPDDLSAGDPEEAAGLISQARDLNTRFRKMESVEEAVERARLRAASTASGGNIDNATRQELRRVLETTPNLTTAEREALEAAVTGQPGQNTARQIGKFAPNGNGLMQALNLGAAASMGPVGAAPAVIGTVAKHISDKTTQRSVENVLRIMAEGGERGAQAAETFAQMAARDPRIARIQAELATSGGAAGGREAGRPRAVMVNSYAPDGTPVLQEY